MVGGRSRQALVSQLAEETDSKPVQCEFESHRGHRKAAATATPSRQRRARAGDAPPDRLPHKTIVEINADRKRQHLTEYGVVFGKTRSKPTSFGSISNGHPVWFKEYELKPLKAKRDVALVSHSDSRLGPR